MASTYTSPSFQTLSLRRRANVSCEARSAKPTMLSVPDRRRFLFLSSGAAVILATGQLTAKAQDIPFFGIRKKIQEVEKEAEDAVEKGIESAEKGLESAEKGIEAAEAEIESAASSSFGALAQAGAVAGAEVVGVVVATSIVNGILGPEAQNS